MYGSVSAENPSFDVSALGKPLADKAYVWNNVSEREEMQELRQYLSRMRPAALNGT